LNKLYYNGTCQNKGAAKEKCLDIDPWIRKLKSWRLLIISIYLQEL
jgi:hypothetical protein